MSRGMLLLSGCLIANLSVQIGRGEDKLPEPLQNIGYDLGPLAAQFDVVECKFFGPDEFTAGNRVVAEETIVWTLAAKKALKGDAIYRLLHPGRAPSPFYEVRFLRTEGDKQVAASARPGGYHLNRDPRWISLKTSPDLAAGETLQVWLHVGEEGSAGRIKNNAAKMMIAAPTQ